MILEVNLINFPAHLLSPPALPALPLSWSGSDLVFPDDDQSPVRLRSNKEKPKLNIFMKGEEQRQKVRKNTLKVMNNLSSLRL